MIILFLTGVIKMIYSFVYVRCDNSLDLLQLSESSSRLLVLSRRMTPD